VNNFLAGFAYGATTVAVGQPFDTIKTRIQTDKSYFSIMQTTKEIIEKEGFTGLYRGGLSLVLGGGLIRSAQFGVYEFVLKQEKLYFGSSDRILNGIFDPQIVFAGSCKIY
jgi:solute carrier family 25 carnitine/acylcarnitine transporter 20/29